MDYLKIIKGVVFQRFEEQDGKMVCSEQHFIPDKDNPIKRVDFLENPITVSFSVQEEENFPIILNQPQ